ncbi:permease [Paramagnetospirillum caucaseum]|uniref:Permease n=2 Tax=Paramagnetospirillum caucaseum TaxID=1244869 RepID=M3AFD2_9PROT|nr:permease [Paramagnetospirillum caucaseum]
MFEAAVAAARPSVCLPPALPAPPPGRTLVIGAGKAAAAMARAVEDHWSGPLSGLVVTRYGHAAATRRIEVAQAAHPVPDAAGEKAAGRMIGLLAGLGPDDLVLCLISGGGSALLARPAPGITLAEKQALTAALLRSGAAIGEINCVRKHLSAVKGGRLAALAAPARLVTLAISDVPGDDPSVIASGPTVADPTTLAEARDVLARYGIAPPPAIAAHLNDPAAETPKALPDSEYRLIATPQRSLEAAALVAARAGLMPLLLGDALEGEAREMAKVMAGVVKSIRAHQQPVPFPAVILSGGEATVTLRAGQGRAQRRIRPGAGPGAEGLRRGGGHRLRHRRHRRLRGQCRGDHRPRHPGARPHPGTSSGISSSGKRFLRIFQGVGRSCSERSDADQRQRLPGDPGTMTLPFDTSLALKLLPLYLLVAIGFALGRFGEVRGQDLGRLALFVLSPAVVFKGFVTADLSGALLALPFAVFGLCSAVALLAARLTGRLWKDGRERIAAFTAGTGNTGFFGIPACLALVGPDALPIVVMVSFGATAYENSVGFYTVARAEASVTGAILRVLKYPGLHACWLGALLNLSGTKVPPAVMQGVDILSGAFVPVGMMIVGLGLAQLRSLRLDLGFTAFTLAVKFAVWPALALAFIGLDRAWLHIFGRIGHQVLLIESLVPLAAVTVVHATLRGIHPDRAAIAVAASTLFALAWLPIVFSRFG